MDPVKHWERMPLDEVRRLLASDHVRGLTVDEVRRRQALYGRNELTKAHEHGLLEKVGAQFASPLVYVLVAAGVVTLLLREYMDMAVILIALAINVIVGALQEERASRAFEKLNASQERRAIVLREGKRLNVPAAELVPGDLVCLEGGYYVPADVRIVSAKDLTVNEAALTGEWLAVPKAADVGAEEVRDTADVRTLAWMGTLIESGYGTGVVVETGSRTELGRIALSLGTISEQVTPLQRNIRAIAHFTSYLVAALLVVLLALGFVRGEPLADMLFIAIAVAVSVIPAGLPAAVTVVLAVGMETILTRGGLVRNLLAAETLGATTVILTDKTGTLTEAHMKLAALYSYEGIRAHRSDPGLSDNRFLLELAVLYADAFLEEGADAPSKLTVHGRPIEKAIILSGLEAGLVQDELMKTYPRLDHLPFTSLRRFGASLHRNPKKKLYRLILSGEPERLVAAATYVRVSDKREKVTDHERKRLLDTLRDETNQGKRVVGVAYRDASFSDIPEEGPEVDALLKSVVFAGFLVFEDPVRVDVAESIVRVRAAGAHVIMLTGDNPDTARTVAARVGIVQPGDELVIRGAEIDAWNDSELYRALSEARVIARALPAHKLRIAQVLRTNGEVVAMTGDGINDAPALRAASIGVAVGSGTEVAKEASDLVLIDSSFSVIVAAIEEGRRIIDNLRKIVAYLLSTSFSEVFLIGGALAGGAPLPLLPAQILWANIVGGDLISFSFAFERKDPSAMRRDPRSARAKDILTKGLLRMVACVSLITGVIAVALYYALLGWGVPTTEVQTIMFVTLSLDSIFFSFSLKSLGTPLWRIDPRSNPYLLGALGASLTFLLMAFVLPPLRTLLGVVPLAPYEVGLLVGVGLVNLVAIECMKYLFVRERTQPAARDR